MPCRFVELGGFISILTPAKPNQKVTYARKKHSVLLWGSVAGDAAITIILQCIIAWVLQMFLVRHDLRKGAVQPLPSSSKQHAPRSDRWLYMLDEDTAAARVLDRRGPHPGAVVQQQQQQQQSENENEIEIEDEEEKLQQTQQQQEQKQKQARLLGQSCGDMLVSLGALLVRSVLLALPALVLFLPASLAVFVAAAGVPVLGGRDYMFPSAIAPIIYKGVLGAAQALFISPEYAVFWMTREGYAAAAAAADVPDSA